jgi:uncharacterized protein YceH (UPF0502 family)
VEEVLIQLQNRETGPLVKTLPKMPGQKENRVMHLMGDEKFNEKLENAPQSMPEKTDDSDKIQQLETEISTLKEHIKRIEEKLDNFIKQFE